MEGAGRHQRRPGHEEKAHHQDRSWKGKGLGYEKGSSIN